jgi:hypothetical protein
MSTFDALKVTLVENDNIRADYTMRPVIIRDVEREACNFFRGQLCRRIPPYLPTDTSDNFDSAANV